jgi:hypothetical protein
MLHEPRAGLLEALLGGGPAAAGNQPLREKNEVPQKMLL